VYNNDSPKVLNLYYARPYNHDNWEEIFGATVSIINRSGHEFFYIPDSKGYYYIASGSFAPEVGESLYLQVQLPDGPVLKSEPQTIPELLGIQSGKFNYNDEVEVKVTSTDGKTTISKQKGMGCYVVIDPQVSVKKYYRLRSDYMLNTITHRSTHIRFDSVITNHGVSLNYHFEVTVDTTLDDYTFHTDGNYPQIGKIEPGVTYNEEDLKHLVNFFDNKYQSIDGFVRWIIFLDVISLNQQTYEYYSQANAMLNEPFRIYDPIPAQITGNMYNASDSSQLVLGNFEVSAMNTKVYEVYLDPVWKVLVTHEITDSTYARFSKVYKTISYDTVSQVTGPAK
jgi:hypothetical protein